MIVAPSILSADFGRLLEEIETVKSAEFLHIDVMDGHFVPNITIGPLVLKGIEKVKMVKDVHLMIANPMKYAPKFIEKGANIVTFHFEAMEKEEDIIELIDLIHNMNCKAGISVKPNTKVEVLDKYLNLVDLVLVMSVEPGFGGQKFMPSALPKILYLSEEKKKNGYNYIIEVDGGINEDTAKECAKCGVEAIVAGTYIFGADKRNKVIDYLHDL